MTAVSEDERWKSALPTSTDPRTSSTQPDGTVGCGQHPIGNCADCNLRTGRPWPPKSTPRGAQHNGPIDARLSCVGAACRVLVQAVHTTSGALPALATSPALRSWGVRRETASAAEKPRLPPICTPQSQSFTPQSRTRHALDHLKRRACRAACAFEVPIPAHGRAWSTTHGELCLPVRSVPFAQPSVH